MDSIRGYFSKIINLTAVESELILGPNAQLTPQKDSMQDDT